MEAGSPVDAAPYAGYESAERKTVWICSVHAVDSFLGMAHPAGQSRSSDPDGFSEDPLDDASMCFSLVLSVEGVSSHSWLTLVVKITVKWMIRGALKILY